jgi:hypothetical protein
MKKILLAAFLLLLADGVKAQVGGTPRELTCTEEAFTFKANIGSGWHFSMGPPETAKIVTAYAPALAFKSIEETPKSSSLSIANTFITESSRPITNRYLLGSLTSPNRGDFQFDKLYYVLPYSHDFWQLNNTGVNHIQADFK